VGRMKIGINTLFLIPNKVGGSETYSRGLIKALYEYDKKNEYVIFCNKENYNTFDNKYNRILVPINATNRFVRIVAEQLIFPIYLYLNKIDVVYSLGYTSPFFTTCKAIVNIFDLNWYYHPEDFGFFQKLILKFFVTHSANFADAITTSSFSSKKSIKEKLNIKKPVEVMYMGMPLMNKPISKNSLLKLGVRMPYIFSLTAAYPHKNVLGLLNIFKSIIDRGHKINLVIAGLGWRSENEMKQFIKKNKLNRNVKILSYVDNGTLSALYKYAKLFLFASFYEGFGIPLLECFHFGVPIISSNAFSLKEVLGNGGVSINPHDQKIFVREIEKSLVDKEYLNALKIKSTERVKGFDWEKSVKIFINLLGKI